MLDIGLPGKNGLELLREMRAAGNQTPVLILTARGTLEERVAGLNSGSDDYLAKPFRVCRAGGENQGAGAASACAGSGCNQSR